MDRAQIVRVPKFVEDAWLNSQPGTVLGILNKDLSKINLSRTLNLPLNQIGATRPAAFTGTTLSLIYQTNADVANARLVTKTAAPCANFLPDIRDPTYKKWLNGPRTDVLAPKTAESPPPNNVNADSRLFHYFGSAPTTTDSSPAWDYEDDEGNPTATKPKKLPASKSNPPPADCQARMFKLFEEKGPTGLTMREILVHLQGRISSSQIRQILDVIAEPRRDRQGKRGHFVLKPEFSRLN